MSTPPHQGTLLVPYRLRCVKVAVQATVITIAGLVVYAFLPHSIPANPILYWGALVAGAAGVALMASLPWPKLFEGPWGLRTMYVWSSMDIILITLLCVAVGSAHENMFFIYALTTVFFAAAAYPAAVQASLLVATFASYLVAQSFIPGAVGGASLTIRFVVLSCSAFMASFLSRELRLQMEAHGQAHVTATRRTDLLAVVARAARGMSTLETERILDEVVDSVLALGFQASSVCLMDSDAKHFRVAHPRGIPEEFASSEHPVSEGIVGMVVGGRKTFVIDDYSDHPRALPALREQGYQSVIAAPIWRGGILTGVLVGGTRVKQALDAVEVEAFELLAAQAGLALENANRFEDQRRTAERLAELDRLKSDFLSNVSHELRTPLTAIEGMTVTVLQRWQELPEASRIELLGRVKANAHALNDIITTLLDFALIESGKMELNRSAFDICDVARTVAIRLTELFTDHPLTVTIEGGLFVNADPMLIERVIENLLSNAAKHTDPGTEVTLEVSSVGSNAVVSVSDKGRGISPEEMEQLGDKFYRGGDPNTRATRGVGLGLAFVKEIVELNSGKLKMRSELGKGSEFSFSLRQTSLPEDPVIRATQVSRA